MQARRCLGSAWLAVCDTYAGGCVVTTGHETAAGRCSHAQMQGMGEDSPCGACMPCRLSASKAALGTAIMGQRASDLAKRWRVPLSRALGAGAGPAVRLRRVITFERRRICVTQLCCMRS